MKRSRLTGRQPKNKIQERHQQFASSMRNLLRKCGEWHGTIAELQRQHFHATPLRHLGRCVGPFIKSDGDRFLWEKRTLEDWGIVHFFKAMDGSRCRTEGCFEDALARSRCSRCFRYLYRHHRGWADDAPLERMQICTWQGCHRQMKLKSPSDVPMCSNHRKTLIFLMDLETLLGRNVMGEFPGDCDWIDARYFHELRKHAPVKNRPLFDRIYGDTVLFKILLKFFGRYEPYVEGTG